MPTTTCATYKYWMDALILIDVPKELINAALVESLQTTKINPETMTCETFQWAVTADSPDEAGIIYTKEAAEMHGGQDFLDECIDWLKAWKTLSRLEGSSVHATADPKKWFIALEGKN